ncbi:MAG: 30S ribosomal protein S16 [Sphingobacteriaceae bacterium]|nr:30S ribosomal protein S16 [Sphingobacteriaceae bacterium]
MATKIRLQRFGKKGKPFYHVVVADSRAPRDGKFIERLGSYNPNTNPATIDINFEKALEWVNSGAQPTDTCRAILSYKGVLYKKHLEGGVKKGALTAEQAEAKFNEWLQGKGTKIEGKKEGLTSAKEEARKAALAAESKKKQERAAALAAKNAPVVEEVEEEAVAEAEEAPVEAEASQELVAETESAPEAVAEPVVETEAVAEPAVETEAVAEPAVEAEAVAEPAAETEAAPADDAEKAE